MIPAWLEVARRCIGIGRREGATHEQRAHDQIGNHKKSGNAGNRQQQREFDRAALRMRSPMVIAAGDAT